MKNPSTLQQKGKLDAPWFLMSFGRSFFWLLFHLKFFFFFYGFMLNPWFRWKTILDQEFQTSHFFFFFFLTNIMHFEHWHRQKCRELAHITSLYLNKNFCCMNILHNSCPIKDTTLRWVATCQMLFHRNSNPNLTLYAL